MSGLEAVGAVASALQLGAYTYRAVQVLSSLRSDFRSAPRWLQERANYLDSLIQTLSCIDAQHYSDDPNLHSLTKDIYHKATALRKVLGKRLQHIEARPFTRGFRILQFTVGERREIKATLAELEQDKSNIHLCITILQSSQIVQKTSVMKPQKVAMAKARLAAATLALSTGGKKSKETAKLQQAKVDEDLTDGIASDLDAPVVDQTSFVETSSQEHTTSYDHVRCTGGLGKRSKDKLPTEPFEPGHKSEQTSSSRRSASVDDLGPAPSKSAERTDTGERPRYKDERPDFEIGEITFESNLHLGSKTVNGASQATAPRTYRFKTVRCFGNSQIGDLALDGDAYRAEKEIEARMFQARHDHRSSI